MKFIEDCPVCGTKLVRKEGEAQHYCQNDIGELWSLLNLMMPTLFKSKETFEEWFDFSKD